MKKSKTQQNIRVMKRLCESIQIGINKAKKGSPHEDGYIFSKAATIIKYLGGRAFDKEHGIGWVAEKDIARSDGLKIFTPSKIKTAPWSVFEDALNAYFGEKGEMTQ